MTTDTEALGVEVPFVATPRKAKLQFRWNPLTSAEALRRARSILATPDQCFSTDEARRIMAGLVAGIDNDYLFPKVPDPTKKFTA